MGNSADNDEGPPDTPSRRPPIAAGVCLAIAILATACGTDDPTTTQATAEARLFVEKGVASVDGSDLSFAETRPIQFGDKISVPDGALALLLTDEFAVELFKGATFHLLEQTGPELAAFLETGHLRFRFKEDTDARFTLGTPVSTLTTIGTTRFTACQPADSKTCVVVEEGAVELEFEGQVQVYRADGTVKQGAFVEQGKSPGPAVCISEQEFQAWIEDARLGETTTPLGALVRDSLECGSVARAPVNIEVLGTEPWTDTLVDVEVDDVISIEAGGRIEVAEEDKLVGPDGDPERFGHRSNLPGLEDTNHGSLVGRIGEEGTPFLVGSLYEMPSDTAGRLYLGINDVGLDNNAGAYFASITVTEVP